MVGATLHNLGHMLRLLIDRHGADGGAWGRRGGHLDLDGARLGDLAVELLQQWGVLQGMKVAVRLVGPEPHLRLLRPARSPHPKPWDDGLRWTLLGILPSQLLPSPTQQVPSALCSQEEALSVWISLVGEGGAIRSILWMRIRP